MLAMHLIGVPKNVFRLRSTRPREENTKRLSFVQKFFADPEAAQALRRSSLVLQLSGGVEALTASIPREGEEPVIVALVKGAAHDIVNSRLRRLFRAMPRDSELQLGPAVGVLLATAADLIVRFKVFRRYPFKLCQLSRRWFPVRCYWNCLQFIHEEEGNLDVGLCLQLQRLAWANGNGCEEQALAWLASPPIQDFIVQVGREALSSSLPVERKLGHVKQWEASRSTNIATASRNMICVRCSKMREPWVQALADAACRLRRLRRTNAHSHQWKIDDSSRPTGGRWTASNQIDGPAQGVGARPPKKKRRTPHGEGARTVKKIGAREEQAQQEFAVQKEALMAAAKTECDELLSSCGTPITRPQWGAWLEENLDEFRERMKTAPARRRRLNTRVRARTGLPTPAPRLQPKTCRNDGCENLWARNLSGRTGWHGLQTHANNIMYLLISHGRDTHYADVEPKRYGDGPAYAFTEEFDLVFEMQRKVSVWHRFVCLSEHGRPLLMFACVRSVSS